MPSWARSESNFLPLFSYLNKLPPADLGPLTSGLKYFNELWANSVGYVLARRISNDIASLETEDRMSTICAEIGA
jgi:hypothetical protein